MGCACSSSVNLLNPCSPFAVVLQADSDPYVEPECPCGSSFCFKCGAQPHSPCTCALWRMWDTKICGDSETKNWMLANAKPCPKCGKLVEKNGGCNLVMCTCRQVSGRMCTAKASRAEAQHQRVVSPLFPVEMATACCFRVGESYMTKPVVYGILRIYAVPDVSIIGKNHIYIVYD